VQVRADRRFLTPLAVPLHVRPRSVLERPTGASSRSLASRYGDRRVRPLRASRGVAARSSELTRPGVRLDPDNADRDGHRDARRDRSLGASRTCFPVMTARACRAVIVGEVADPHVALVLERLPAAGTVVVDAASLPSVLIKRSDFGWTLLDTTGEPVQVSRDSTARGWIRRYSPPGWDEGVQIGSHRAAVLTARLALLGALMRDVRIRWLSPSDRLSAAENKLLQYDAARDLGIGVPRTVVCADLQAVVAEVGEPFVVKPLGAAHFNQSGEHKLVYAESVSIADLAGTDLLEAPFLMQEHLQATAHLRVVTVEDEAWVCELKAESLPTDWRRADAAHGAFRLTEDRAEIGAQAIALEHAMGVGYSSQDWIVHRDGASFIDLNPAGQWAFLPAVAADDVTASIGAWLNQAPS